MNPLDWLLDLWPARGVGPRGERVAARHLRRAGYRLLARNLRFAHGEIDILARSPDGKSLVVVEVKSRELADSAQSIPGGGIRPEIHVNPAKQRKLVSLGQQAARRLGMPHAAIRFDVIGVDLAPRGKPVVRHHVCAFESRQ
ncbi:MAG: YraN family protein [Planctomycetota bacterium]|nr:YraN family protein [Planctomycetota bacterium]